MTPTHHHPSLPYSGLTIVLDKQSRHDRAHLIDGFAGQDFDKMLAPLSRRSCDIRLASSNEPLLEGTKVVLALGPGAIKEFGAEASLNEQRGCPFVFNGVVVIGSYAPQDACDRQNYAQEDEVIGEKGTEKDHQKTKRKNWAFWLAADVAKARRVAAEGLAVPTLAYKPVINGEIEEAIALLEASSGKDIFVDIETIPENQQLTCLGFGVKTGDELETHIVCWTDYKNEALHTDIERARFLRALSIAFQRNRIICHNALFDLFILAYKYKVLLPLDCADTMLMHHRCYLEQEKSLGHLGSFYTDELYHKNEGVFEPRNHVQQQQLWSYNGKDVYLTALCYYEILRAASPEQVASMAQANEMIRPHLVVMLQGLRLDMPKRETVVANHQRREVQFERILRLLTGWELNARSPKQVSEYLFTAQQNKKPLKDPTNEKSLLQVYNRSGLPSIKVILALRSARKAASALSFPVFRGDRTTCSYAIAGTTTLRLASRTLLKFRNRKDTGWGTNMQNWGKANRECIIADPGKVLFQVDQSGAEAMMVAYLSRRGNFQLLMEAGIKSHVFVAIHLFPSHWAELLGLSDLRAFTGAKVTELRGLPQWNELDKLIRASGLKYATAKMVCHAANYDMKAPTFQTQALVKSDNQLVLTIKECNFLLNTYHAVLPEIRSSYHTWTRGKLRKDRTLVNLWGHPRHFYGPFDHSMDKEGYAFRPQSSSGVLSHKVLCAVQSNIEGARRGGGLWEGVDVLQNGHDSIMGQAPEGKVKDVVRAIMPLFNVTFQGLDGPFTMKSEAGIGYNWKPVGDDNPNGLDEEWS